MFSLDFTTSQYQDFRRQQANLIAENIFSLQHENEPSDS